MEHEGPLSAHRVISLLRRSSVALGGKRRSASGCHATGFMSTRPSVGGRRLRAERDGNFGPATDTAVETLQKRAFTPALLVIGRGNPCAAAKRHGRPIPRIVQTMG